MAPENEGGILQAIYGKNYRMLLLLVITVLTVSLVVWSFSSSALDTNKQYSLHDQLKLKLDTLPPIPIKVIIEQKQINESISGSNNGNHRLQESATKPPLWNYNWDLREWKDPKDMENVPSRTLYLIRHGQYNYTTGKLTELGHEQAKLTAERLKQMNRPISSIVYSSLDRTVETASHIKAAFPTVNSWSDDLLREGGPIVPKPTVSFWSLPDTSYHVDGPRLESCFRKYFYRADKSQQYQTFDIIVGHTNAFRYFVLRALQLESSAWMRIGLAHASITSITINPDSLVFLSLMGDSGHIPMDKHTY